MQAIVPYCIYVHVQYFYLFSPRVPPLPRALNLFTTHIPSLHMNCRNFLKIPPTPRVLSVGIFLYKCGSFSPSHSLEQLKIEDKHLGLRFLLLKNVETHGRYKPWIFFLYGAIYTKFRQFFLASSSSPQA